MGIECIGFIMDGNRRWAKEQARAATEGHRAGAEKLDEVLQWVQEVGIAHAVFYTFSTENWKRSREEVVAFMLLLEQYIDKLQETQSEALAVRFIGRREDLSESLQQRIADVEAGNSAAPACTMWIALSYGGRAEIVSAANTLAWRGETIDETSFAAALWSAGMPDPGLIIRTGGEQRLSNFLLWSAAYSELYFSPTFWPAFTKDEFHAIVEWYEGRERRKGA